MSGPHRSISSFTNHPATRSIFPWWASNGCGTCSIPEGRAEINELHVPLGRAVKLTMTSQDVIHSFFIPAFRIKQDVLPGRYTTLWFRPTKIGRHHLFCAEYCGTNHSLMTGWVHVMEPAEYEQWLAAGGPGPRWPRRESSCLCVITARAVTRAARSSTPPARRRIWPYRPDSER